MSQRRITEVSSPPEYASTTFFTLFATRPVPSPLGVRAKPHSELECNVSNPAAFARRLRRRNLRTARLGRTGPSTWTVLRLALRPGGRFRTGGEAPLRVIPTYATPSGPQHSRADHARGGRVLSPERIGPTSVRVPVSPAQPMPGGRLRKEGGAPLRAIPG